MGGCEESVGCDADVGGCEESVGCDADVGGCDESVGCDADVGGCEESVGCDADIGKDVCGVGIGVLEIGVCAIDTCVSFGWVPSRTANRRSIRSKRSSSESECPTATPFPICASCNN